MWLKKLSCSCSAKANACDVAGSLAAVVGTRRWITSLNLTVTEPWRAWYSRTGQVGGFTEGHDGLRFATVRNAGVACISSSCCICSPLLLKELALAKIANHAFMTLMFNKCHFDMQATWCLSHKANVACICSLDGCTDRNCDTIQSSDHKQVTAPNPVAVDQ